VQDAVVGGTHTLRPIGELDLASAPHLHRIIESVQLAGANTVTIDLADVTFMDCCGLRAVLRGGDFRDFTLLPGAGQARRLLEVLGLLDLLPVPPSYKLGL
jgi:anti-anti-sigma factor